MNVGIVGTGSYLPQDVLTNDKLAAKVDVTDDWILDKTGIRERRIASSEEATSDLAAIASGRALQSAAVSPPAIDLIVVATSTGDHPAPATACCLQTALGAGNAVPMDVSAGCSGFLYALRVGHDMLMASPEMRYALIVGSEVLSRFVDYEDKRTCILFGDGAGAVVLAKVDTGGITSCILGADGQGVELAGIPAGGSRMPASSTTLENRSHYIKMDGRKVREFVSIKVCELVSSVLEIEGVSKEAVKLVVPHQANGRMLDEWTKLLGLTVDQVYRNVEKVGNTSSASIPIALDQAVRDSLLKSGDLVLLLAFGGGGTWGATLMRWCL